jgi:pyruvate/2-oxoglutarate dehydrogenase complex dihydrolipoamide dehydrogenase (E3) component
VALNTLLAPWWRQSAKAPWMPSVVYTHPEVAQAGLTQREASRQGMAVETITYPLSESDRAITESATDGFLRIVTDARRGHVLGVTIAGAHASTHLPLWVNAIRHRQTPAALLGTVHAYPTWTEASKAIAGRWQMSRVKPWMTALLRTIQTYKRRC